MNNVKFTNCFSNGVKFYTVNFGAFRIWGFITQDDVFDISQVVPQARSDDMGFAYGNWSELKHDQLVQKLKGRFCPQRLRKFLNL